MGDSQAGRLLRVSKPCSICKQTKPLEEFHKQPSGKLGRHTYCRVCLNARNRRVQRKKADPAIRRERSLRYRYGINSADVEEMIRKQGGCGICGQNPPKRAVVDHCHKSGAVRGVLCHRCNIFMAAIDDEEYMANAKRYLDK